MMLAFLIDQCQQRCCALFQAAQAKAERARYFWERLRALFLDFQLPDWETLYRALAFGHHPVLGAVRIRAVAKALGARALSGRATPRRW